MARKPLRALQREVAGELVRSTDRTSIAILENDYERYLEDGLVKPNGYLVNATTDLHQRLVNVRAEEEDAERSFACTMELLMSEVWRVKAAPKKS